jgi:hypothetical protein
VNPGEATPTVAERPRSGRKRDHHCEEPLRSHREREASSGDEAISASRFQARYRWHSSCSVQALVWISLSVHGAVMRATRRFVETPSICGHG